MYNPVMSLTVAPRELKTRVFDILEHQGRKMAWFAERTGFTDQYLYQIKMGNRAITQNFIDAAVRALDLPFETLFYVPMANVIAEAAPEAERVA